MFPQTLYAAASAKLQRSLLYHLQRLRHSLRHLAWLHY